MNTSALDTNNGVCDEFKDVGTLPKKLGRVIPVALITISTFVPTAYTTLESKPPENSQTAVQKKRTLSFEKAKRLLAEQMRQAEERRERELIQSLEKYFLDEEYKNA